MPINTADTPADVNKLMPNKLSKLINGDACVFGLTIFIIVPQCQIQ